MSFQLVPNSVTLMTLNGEIAPMFALFHRNWTHYVSGLTVEDKTHSAAQKAQRMYF